MTAPSVLALDPSLTGTGWAFLPPGQEWAVGTIKTEGKILDSYAVRGKRLDTVCDHIGALAAAHHPDLIAVEGPSLRSKGPGTYDRAGLWWLVFLRLSWTHDLLVIPPASRSKYATGNGNASKEAVCAAAIRRYLDAPIANNNEADAVVLAAMTTRAVGHPVEASLPKINLDAMKGLPADWLAAHTSTGKQKP